MVVRRNGRAHGAGPKVRGSGLGASERRWWLGAKVFLYTLVACAATMAAHGQVVVQGSGSSHNQFGPGTPSSGDMNNPGDVFIGFDLELWDRLYLNRFLFMEASSDGEADSNQTIFFYDGGSRTGESFGWSEPSDAFELTDDIRLTGGGESIHAVDGDLVLEADGFFLQSEARQSDFGGPFFNWIGVYSDGTRDTLMRLVGPGGNLSIKGELRTNQSFDLAEAFWASEPVGAGEVVAVDSSRPDAVRRARGPNDTVVGVVSSDPGISLGGGALSVDDLRSAWGEEVATAFRRARPGLISRVLKEQPSLAEEVERLQSLETFRVSVQTSDRRMSARLDPPAADDVERRRQFSPVVEMDRAEMRAAYEREKRRLREMIQVQVIERFMDERFVKVALAGRVPVEAEATSAPIRAGDPLAPSPMPGRVRRATGPGVVLGTALEGLEGGTGSVLALVDRSWFGKGDGASAASTAEARRSPEQDSSSRRRAVGSERSAEGAVRTPSPTVAEYHRVDGPVAPGEVLVVELDRPGSLEVGWQGEDPAVVGIVAGSPGVLFGERMTPLEEVDPELARELDVARRDGDRQRARAIWSLLSDLFQSLHAPIAVAGSVRADVDASYGPVEVGDLLTTSGTRGHLMRAPNPPAPGTVVGKALEPLAAGRDTIRVLVMHR